MGPVKVKDDAYWIGALDILSSPAAIEGKSKAKATFVPTAEELENCRQWGRRIARNL